MLERMFLREVLGEHLDNVVDRVYLEGLSCLGSESIVVHAHGWFDRGISSGWIVISRDEVR